jgi:hypothetical protein
MVVNPFYAAGMGYSMALVHMRVVTMAVPPLRSFIPSAPPVSGIPWLWLPFVLTCSILSGVHFFKKKDIHFMRREVSPWPCSQGFPAARARSTANGSR